jgi:hypothetical protein
LNEKALKKGLRKALQKWQGELNQPLDWDRFERILEAGMGIPLPVTAGTAPADAVIAQAQPIARPRKWFGQPEVPRLSGDGWQVLATETASEISAKRIAAILNHQGPPIPARSILKGERYQVIAGPFPHAKAAKAALRRLQVDLELKGRLMAPPRQLTANSRIGIFADSLVRRSAASRPDPAAPQEGVLDANSVATKGADATGPEEAAREKDDASNDRAEEWRGRGGIAVEGHYAKPAHDPVPTAGALEFPPDLGIPVAAPDPVEPR